MMDGRAGAIRARLDAENFEEAQILSYALNMPRPFMGPFAMPPAPWVQSQTRRG